MVNLPVPLLFRKAAQNPGEPRQQERLQTFLPVRLSWGGRQEYGFLLDLSTTGARLGAWISPAANDAVEMEWEGQVFAGRCVWASDCRIGLAFDGSAAAIEIVRHA